MIPRTRAPAELFALAERQAGVLSREQAAAHGISDRVRERFLEIGLWQPLARGIYWARSRPNWEGLAWAGVLIGGDGSGLIGQAAGHLHGLVDSPPEIIEIGLPAGRRRVNHPPWEFKQRRLAMAGEPPALSVDDTVLDLCQGADIERMTSIIADAVGGRRTTLRRLREALDVRPRYQGRRTLLPILREIGNGTHSLLERRYTLDVERAHGLPSAQRQARLGAHRVDNYYAEYRLIVELDGREFHVGSRLRADVQRDNDHLAGGLLTLRFGWPEVTWTPCATAMRVADVLIRNGWSGMPQRCERCDDAELHRR